MSASSRPLTRADARLGDVAGDLDPGRDLVVEAGEHQPAARSRASSISPASTGTGGRAGRLRAAQATASASTSRSTRNFTGHRLLRSCLLAPCQATDGARPDRSSSSTAPSCGRADPTPYGSCRGLTQGWWTLWRYRRRRRSDRRRGLGTVGGNAAADDARVTCARPRGRPPAVHTDVPGSDPRLSTGLSPWCERAAGAAGARQRAARQPARACDLIRLVSSVTWL